MGIGYGSSMKVLEVRVLMLPIVQVQSVAVEGTYKMLKLSWLSRHVLRKESRVWFTS